MFLRALLILGVFGLCYWCLGTFAFMRIRGLPHTARWVLSILLALWTGGFLPILR